MENKHKKHVGIYYDGTKAVDLWGDDLNGWTLLSGEANTVAEDYYKLIPTLFRAVQSNAYSVATMPFQLMKGKTVYDKSADWENKIGFIPNPFTLLQLINGSLDLGGQCYLFRERSAVMTKLLRYQLFNSVNPKINEDNGEIEYFERPQSNGTVKKYTKDDYVYFWLPDPFVEVGPARNYPAKAAFDACSVLYNMDVFASKYIARGMVKPMLVLVKGMPSEGERNRIEDFLSRFTQGMKNAFRVKVFNADTSDVKTLGEGFKELENVTIGQEKREDIAIALNIPMSILFAGAANYATASQDALNYLNQNIVPRCIFIESILNEQVFDPLGLHWEFLPETLDAMQEDETERAAALVQYVNAGYPLLMASDILGIELTDEQRAELEAAEEEKKRKAEELAKQMAQKPEEPEEEPGKEEPPEDDTNVNTTFKTELMKWQRKAINAMKKGKPANVTFDTTIIPAEMCETIMTALGNAQSEGDIKDAFNVTSTPKVEFEGGIMALAVELRRANDLLERNEG